MVDSIFMHSTFQPNLFSFTAYFKDFNMVNMVYIIPRLSSLLPLIHESFVFAD